MQDLLGLSYVCRPWIQHKPGALINCKATVPTSEAGQIHARPNELLIIAHHFRISLMQRRTVRSCQVAHSGNAFLVHGFVTTCGQAIIHMNTQENLGYAPVVFVDILDKRDYIVVYVDKALVEQTFDEYLIPAMSSLLQAIDEASALQYLAFRQPVSTRQINIDSFLAFS